MLFGKDYEEYRKYLYMGYSLFIRGSVQPNPWKKEVTELEFKIKSILLLNNARDELVKNLSIRMSIQDLNEEIIAEMHKQSDKNKGKSTLRFNIYDENEGISVDMFSRNISVLVTNELIDFLNSHPEIEYKVN
jgi:DNA polymerase III subunit alpha